MSDESDMRFSAQEFGTLLNWYMVSDPWPLSALAQDRIEKMLNKEARERGWDNWVEAYHEV